MFFFSVQFCLEKKPFVEIRSSFLVLERIACAVKWNEAVLLVGETGTGKTTLVQILATRLGQKLTVLVTFDRAFSTLWTMYNHIFMQFIEVADLFHSEM